MTGRAVAVVGADGAGKTTVVRHLVDTLPVRAVSLYMGDNPESATGLLPTTRALWWARRRRRARRGGPGRAGSSTGRRLLGLAASLVVLAVQVAEEANQLARARRHLRRGRLVLFDRYFPFDYAHAGSPGRRNLVPRLHRAWLGWAFPEPDLVLCLDAPASVLFARKPEGDLAAREWRRVEYLELAETSDRFTVVDVARPWPEITRDVVALVSSVVAPADDGTNG